MEQPRGREDMCGGKWMVARDDKRQLQYINYNSEKVTIVFSLDQIDFPQRARRLTVSVFVSSLQIVRKARSETRERTKRAVPAGASARQEGGRSSAGVRMESAGQAERSRQTACSSAGVLSTAARNRAGYEGTYYIFVDEN